MRTIAFVLFLVSATAAPLPAQAVSHPRRISGPAPLPAWLIPAPLLESAPASRGRTTRTRWAEGAGIGGIVSSLSAMLLLHHDPCGVLGTPDRPCDLGTALGGLLILALPGALVGGLIGTAISTS